MSEFPRKAFDYYTAGNKQITTTVLLKDLRQAIAAYDQLAERHVMEVAEYRGLLGKLRLERQKERRHLREVEPRLTVQFPDEDLV